VFEYIDAVFQQVDEQQKQLSYLEKDTEEQLKKIN